MGDDLTVLGPDGIRRSYDEHYDTMMDVEQDPTGALQAIQMQHYRIEELQARVAELGSDAGDWKNAYEACATDTLELTKRAEAAEALLPEAVKAGMLKGAKMIQPEGEKPDVDPSNMGDVQDEAFWLADMNASTRIRALASDPETIARIVAQLKEGRG